MKRPSLLGWMLALATASWAQDTEPAQPFDPHRHLPGPGHAVLTVTSIDGLRQGFGETLLGSILTHPGTRAGTSVLVAEIEGRVAELTAPAAALAQAGLEDVRRLLAGGFTLVLGELRAEGPPQLALALPAPGGVDDLNLVESLLGLAFPGGDGQAEVLGELVVRPMAGPFGSLSGSLVGDHVVLATEQETLQLAHALWKTNADTESLAAALAHVELSAVLGPRAEGVRLAVDLAGLREAGLALADARGGGEVARERLAQMGFDQLQSLGVQVGFRERGLANTVHLGLAGEATGVLGALTAACLPVRRMDEALALIPAACHEVAAWRLAPSLALEHLGERLPDQLAELRHVLERLGEPGGFSPVALWDRLPELGDLEVYSVAVDPPAGGLFADRLYLARTDELAPYWQLAVDLTVPLQPHVSSVEVAGAEVVSLDLVPPDRGSEVLRMLLRGASLDELPGFAGMAAMMPLSLPFGQLARADLPDGWTVVSGSSHAVSRFLVLGPSSEPMRSNEPAAERIRQVLGGAVLGGVFDTGKTLLATYNTLLQIGDRMAPVASLLGIDVRQLPPAEAFLQQTGAGYLRLVSNDKGLTLWSHRALGAPPVLLGAAASLWTGLLFGSLSTASATSLAEATLTRARMTRVLQAMRLYHRDHGRYPDELAELLEPAESGDPYLDGPDLLVDAWERPLQLVRLDETRFELVSLGADGVPGGEAGNADVIGLPDGSVRAAEEP